MDIKPYLRSVSIEKPLEEGDCFPFTIPSISNIETITFNPNMTIFVGENGTGKSTLLEAIATIMEVGGQGGTGNSLINDASGPSILSRHMKCKKGFQKPKDKFFLRAESLYNFATHLENMANDPDAHTSPAQVFRRYGGKSLHNRSHGEAFMSILVDALSGNGLYILDEPEAALSPTRQMSALVRMHDLVAAQSQFIVATHSPILMAYPGATIYLLDEEGYRQVAFKETEHYRVTRDFLNNHEGMLRHLLN